MSDSPLKRCADCGEDKALTEFWKRGKAKDGFAPYCKTCYKAHDAESRRRRMEREGRERQHRTCEVEVPSGMKWCPDCGAVKDIDEFTKNRSAPSGRASYCRPCHNTRSRESVERRYGSTRHFHLKRRYGISAAEADSMLKAQMGVCAICLTPGPEHVDHDHKTGRVRAILCFNCNGGLGQFKDRPDLLRRGADYLEGNVWKPTLVAPGVYRLPS